MKRGKQEYLKYIIQNNLKSKKSMEKIKEQEQETFVDENGILKCQIVYNTNVCIINEVVVKGKLQIIIMCIIKNLEDDDETTICLEIYNNNVPENIIQSNYIYFSFEYNDMENYQFDEHLKCEIDNTLTLSDAYRL